MHFHATRKVLRHNFPQSEHLRIATTLQSTKAVLVWERGEIHVVMNWIHSKEVMEQNSTRLDELRGNRCCVSDSVRAVTMNILTELGFWMCVCECVHMYACSCECRGQRTIFSVVPQIPSALFL